jgi:PKHD-type hydroxylase|tara:strand:+ start:269 stop:868 length:600 start_codon:yes stop_codon:yes gene_type:complete
MFKSYNFDQKENDPQNYYFYEEGFNKEELSTIYKGIQSLEENKADTIGSNSNEVRSSKVRWIPQNDDWHWLYEKLSDMISTANNTLWNFDLTHIPEQIQYTEYYATEKGHYTWHQDIGPGMLSKRKISITVQLSGPEEYEGGDLEVFTGGNYKEGDFIKSPKGMGTVFIFPSYLLHRVTPVTKGIRRSFVLWVGGSPYR